MLTELVITVVTVLACALVLSVYLLRRNGAAAAERGAMDDRIIEISQLAGGLAHEIRNPLSTLLLNLKLLEEDICAGLDAQSDTLRRGQRRIALARAEAERLQRMLEEFLLIVGPLGLKREIVDLNAVVHRLVEFYGPEAERHGIQLHADYSPAPVRCPLDAQVFQQAVLNLLINARDALPAGGEIRVSTESVGDRCVLTVADTGDGMTPEVRQKAFTAFYSTKPNGSGLGLATTGRIVAAHDGRIDVETAPGKGTRFTISLPAATTAPAGSGWPGG